MNNKNIKGNGYQCFHCGQYEVYWQADFMFEDYGFEGNGIVQECHCYSCGADITYRIPIVVENDMETDDKRTEYNRLVDRTKHTIDREKANEESWEGDK